MVDNKLIKDTQYFKLPLSLINNIVITKSSEFDNLKNNDPNLSIVNIITKVNASKSNEIMISEKAEK